MKLREFLGGFRRPFNLIEFLNIESGYLGISGVQFKPQCQDCDFELAPHITCSKCGLAPKTFVSLRAGDGDAVYPVFQEWNNKGGAVWFYEDYALKDRLS